MTTGYRSNSCTNDSSAAGNDLSPATGSTESRSSHKNDQGTWPEFPAPTGSRSNLEFGYWTEDASLLDGVSRFLLRLIAASEGVDPEADLPTPDFVPVDYDDEAFVEYMRDSELDEGDSEESV